MNVNTITIFTDGGCEKNGQSNARASWAIAVYQGTILLTTSSALLVQGQYGDEVPTNMRAEELALLKAFEFLMVHDLTQVETPVHVWTDSEVGYKTITQWYQGWEIAKTVHKKANPVLVKEMMAAYRSVPVVVHHIKELGLKSHGPEPRDPAAKFVWVGNRVADRECEKLLK